MQSEGIRGEEDGYGMRAVEQSWHSQAFLQLRKITAITEVSGGGSEGSASFQKSELHKSLKDSLLLALCFKTASSFHSVLHCKHFVKLLSVIYRWGNQGLEELSCPKPPSRPTANTAGLPPCSSGVQGHMFSWTNSPNPPEQHSNAHHSAVHSVPSLEAS